MRKADWPERDAFIDLVDRLKEREGYRYDSALAEAAGLSPTAISNWRNGKVIPSYRSVSALARAVNEQPNELARVAGLLDEAKDAGEPGPEPLPVPLERLVRNYREADDARRAQLLQQIEVINLWFEASATVAPQRRAS